MLIIVIIIFCLPNLTWLALLFADIIIALITNRDTDSNLRSSSDQCSLSTSLNLNEI